MSVQGKSWLISIIHKRIIVKEIQDRILSSKMWDSEEIIFIDNVNLHKTPCQCRGILFCILYNNIWHLAIMIRMSSTCVSFCLLQNLDLFHSTNEDVKDLSLNKILNHYFSDLITTSLTDFSRSTCLYLNQVCGNRPYGQGYTYNPVNQDNCYDCCVDGPDILFPKGIMQQTIDIKYYPTLTSLPLLSGNHLTISKNRKNLSLCLIGMTLIFVTM